MATPSAGFGKPIEPRAQRTTVRSSKRRSLAAMCPQGLFSCPAKSGWKTVLAQILGEDGLAHTRLCETGPPAPTPREARRSRTGLHAAPASLQHHEHRVQLLDRPFQLRDRVRRQFLGLGQFVGVFERFVLEPLEAVELVVALLDLVDVRSVASGPPVESLGLAFAPAVGVVAVALLELGEVLPA